MFNPKLKGVYSDCVEISLIKLAEDFEKNNIECWVYGSKDMFDIKSPYIMFLTEVTTESFTKIFMTYQEYTDALTPEETEEYGGIFTLEATPKYATKLSLSLPLWV